MDEISSKQTNKQTKLFYEKHALSFSSTRKNAWSGWDLSFKYIESLNSPINLLDIACGNLRFESYLIEKGVQLESITAVDTCAELVKSGKQLQNLRYLNFDAIEGLENDSYLELVNTSAYNLGVAFGFMHHISNFELRKKFLDITIDALSPKGIFIVSFWQFSKDPKILDKAIEATNIAAKTCGLQLNPNKGDFFLDWQNNTKAFRYCHDFSDDEIDKLTDGLNVIDRYSADGKNDDLNCYVVIKKD